LDDDVMSEDGGAYLDLNKKPPEKAECFPRIGFEQPCGGRMIGLGGAGRCWWYHGCIMTFVSFSIIPTGAM
jgi:hypothetical protein